MNTTTIENCVIGSFPQILENIHQPKANIAIYNRDTAALSNEINSLLKHHLEIRLSGDVATIMNALNKAIDSNKYDLITKDIQVLLNLFKDLTHIGSFRLQLTSIDSVMCPRFHADNNELRMLCTYSGPGTLWLPDHAVDRKAYLTGKSNQKILSDESLAQQVDAGDVVILKGGRYPDATPILHRSPDFKRNEKKRILLCIDPNESLRL